MTLKAKLDTEEVKIFVWPTVRVDLTASLLVDSVFHASVERKGNKLFSLLDELAHKLTLSSKHTQKLTRTHNRSHRCVKLTSLHSETSLLLLVLNTHFVVWTMVHFFICLRL